VIVGTHELHQRPLHAAAIQRQRQGHQVNIDPGEIGLTRRAMSASSATRNPAGAACGRSAGQAEFKRYAGWVQHLRDIDRQGGRAGEADEFERRADPSAAVSKEVRDFVNRDAYVIVTAWRSELRTPVVRPSNRGIASIPGQGAMGVGLPLGLGGVAHPDKQVLVLHGDGSFGLNAMELDTAARHGINVVCVVSLNGGWTADPDRDKPGRELGYTR
jgi:thiamine pyrophosphate-dependent acetolactate synthase large subunit-like protein